MQHCRNMKKLLKKAEKQNEKKQGIQRVTTRSYSDRIQSFLFSSRGWSNQERSGRVRNVTIGSGPIRRFVTYIYIYHGSNRVTLTRLGLTRPASHTIPYDSTREKPQATGQVTPTSPGECTHNNAGHPKMATSPLPLHVPYSYLKIIQIAVLLSS